MIVRMGALALALSVSSSIGSSIAEAAVLGPSSADTSNVEAVLGVTPASGTLKAVKLEFVLMLAREHAPAIAAARARMIQEEGRRLTNSRLPDPTLAAGVGRGQPRGGGPGRFEQSVEIGQFLPAPGNLRNRSRAGDAAIEASTHDFDAVVADVMLEAKRLFFEATVARDQAEGLSQAARDAQALHDLVTRRVDAGEAPEGDRLRARVEALRANLEARAASARAEGARAALNRFLLGVLGDDYELDSEMDPKRLSPAPPDLMERAISRNPDYLAALARVEEARWSASAERASRLPGLDLTLGGVKELDRQAASIGVAISIPLWNRNEGGIRTSQGRLAEAQAEAAGIKAEFEKIAERLIRRDAIAREIALTYRNEINPAARESLTIAKFSLEQGEASLLNWLEARRSYLETLRAAYQAQLDAFLTRADLERLTGDLHDFDAR